MLHLIQYLKGYVCIRVWGYSPERFINLCGNHDIFLWDIKNNGTYYSMCITIHGFKKLKPIVKKTGTKVAIQNKCGLPFFIPKVKRRKIFLFGLLGSLLFWIWMSTFIWAVDLTGNYSVSNDIFMDFLKNNDVYVGMKRKDVDIEELEKKIRQDFGIVTWTSAKIDGTRLEIHIKENEVDIQNTENDTQMQTDKGTGAGSDLVSEADGIIVGIITRKGVPMVSVHTEVKKGDILVAGSVPVYNEDATVRKYQYYDADADIWIERQLHQMETIPFAYEKKEYTGGEKKEIFLSLFGKEMVFGIGKVTFADYDKVTDKQQIKLLDNFYIPVYYGKSINREYIVKDTIYSEEEVKTIFSQKLSKFVQSLEEKGVQIIKKNVTIGKKNKKWQMDMDFVIMEQTGKNIPIVPMTPDAVPGAVPEEDTGAE